MNDTFWVGAIVINGPAIRTVYFDLETAEDRGNPGQTGRFLILRLRGPAGNPEHAETIQHNPMSSPSYFRLLNSFISTSTESRCIPRPPSSSRQTTYNYT